MIGQEELIAAFTEQRDLTTSVLTREDRGDSYFENLGVDASALWWMGEQYAEANLVPTLREHGPAGLPPLVIATALRFFALGVLLGREHAP